MQRATSAQAAERIEHKHGDVGVEGGAIFGHAMVLAVHGASGGAQAAAAGVFEALARSEGRLLTDHARPLDLFGHAVGVVDIPASGHQLCGDVAGIGDGDGVGKAKHTHARCRLIRQVLRAHNNGELWVTHALSLDGFRSASGCLKRAG
jgi:hypothetical protein